MKLTKDDLAECKQSVLSGDKNAALALYRNSMVRGHRGKACARFLFAKSLGVQFTEAELAYQQQAWASLGRQGKERVRSSVEQLLKTL